MDSVEFASRSYVTDLPCLAAGANRHDLYLDFIGKLTGALESFSDICFCFPWGESIDAHRFFLTARCPALGERQHVTASSLCALAEASAQDCLVASLYT